MRTHSYFLQSGLLGLLLFTLPCAAHAQRWVVLVDYTNTFWKFDDSRSDLGTAWQLNDFDDSGWQGGTGLFGFETNVTVFPFPFVTTMALGPTNDVTTNFYLRAHFNLDPSNHLAGLILWASNYVDDGCVIHLNGVEAGRIRVPLNQNATTYASGTVGGNTISEGTNEVLQLPAALLHSGDNVLAVEVHQAYATSSDIVWGMKLSALIPVAGSVLTQPQSQTVELSHQFNLCVETFGGPITYQWQTNNGPDVWVNISAATNACYAETVTTRPITNDYRVLCVTPINSVTSSVATVTVVPDQGRGPLVVSATVLEEAAQTNRVELRFDENLLLKTVHFIVGAPILTNDTFRVALMPSNIGVGVSDSRYAPANFPSFGTPPRVTLTMYATNWLYRSNYYIVLNNIRDVRTNVIAPNTIIPVTWPSNASYPAFTSPLPPVSLTNEINVTSLGSSSFQLSWPSNAYGWALERSTNIAGPWTQAQPYMANPYVTNFSSATSFFYRLHATQ